MLPINEKVFVAKYETSNEEYKKFLINLQRSKKFDLYAVALYDSTGWKKKFQYAFNDPMVENYHFHPAYQNYPIVNITYEGAKAYCEWLTQQYNSQRKRKYTQVLFRLPTKAEWLEMATAGDKTKINPFNGPFVRGRSGAFLANIKTSSTNFNDDGGLYTVLVNAYDPNSLGFYCTLGNVSEMLNEKGKAMGGSWYNTYEESTFDKQQTYTTSDPGIGFRIVMEVIVK